MGTFEQEAKAFRFRTKKPPVVVVRESDVVNAGIRWFYAQGLFAWRNNSGGFKTESGQFIRYGLSGSSDIIAIQNGTGRAIFAEAKSTTGKQTDNQIAFQHKVEQAGALYIVFRSVDDLEANKTLIMGIVQ